MNKAIEFLKKIKDGDFGLWSNTLSQCLRSDAEAAFGNSGNAPDGVALIGDVMNFRSYPHSSFAPYGIIVWLIEDHIELVQINSPVIVYNDIIKTMGTPELELPSGLLLYHSQIAYTSKGLVFHVSKITSETLRIYVFKPCSKEQFAASPLSKLKQERIRKI